MRKIRVRRLSCRIERDGHFSHFNTKAAYDGWTDML